MADAHHIKTYTVFIIIGILLVALLAYLYVPFRVTNLHSQALIVSDEVSAPVISQETSPDDNAGRRMRFTSLLLRYQGELVALESKKAADKTPDDEKKIQELRVKVDNLQSMIAELAKK